MHHILHVKLSKTDQFVVGRVIYRCYGKSDPVPLLRCYIAVRHLLVGPLFLCCDESTHKNTTGPVASPCAGNWRVVNSIYWA